MYEYLFHPTVYWGEQQENTHPYIYIYIYIEKGCILPFPKKGDLGLAKNCRGITFTSIAAKIYNALLRNRIEPKIENILR